MGDCVLHWPEAGSVSRCHETLVGLRGTAFVVSDSVKPLGMVLPVCRLAV